MECVEMQKELLMTKRNKAKELHGMGWSIRKIAGKLVSSTRSVRLWTKMNTFELSKDNRGWKKGKPRKYTQDAKREIRKMKRHLLKENSYFIGSKVVHKNYENQFGEKISKSFVDRTLREAKLVKTPRKKRKGVSKYMKYPQRTLDRLGKIMLSVDFIGPKYLNGSSDRINFISCKYIRPEKVGIVKRITGQTAEQTIKSLKELWKEHPIPDVVKVDNDMAFGANLSLPKCIGSLTFFLLNLGICPLYIAPRSPWNNGHVEGFNSVFSKKFWNKLQFTDENEVDIKIKDFNMAYEKYSKLIHNNPKSDNPRYIDNLKDIKLDNKNIQKFKANKIYFLRIVRRKNEKGSKDEYGFIDILKKEMKLPKDLINLFVFCVLDIKSKQLKINIELDDGTLKEIKKIKFFPKNVVY